jgi:hypothetical protein
MASTEEHNAELMQTLDDAWNSKDEDAFKARHKPTSSSAGPVSRPDVINDAAGLAAGSTGQGAREPAQRRAARGRLLAPPRRHPRGRRRRRP